MEIFIFIGIGSIAFCIILIAVLFYKTYEPPRVRAGKQGEKEAIEIIKQVLQEDDILLTNVCVKYGEKEAELDNVIINSKGVFIIEVKNYSGTLIGDEEDYEWTKYKVRDVLSSVFVNFYQKVSKASFVPNYAVIALANFFHVSCEYFLNIQKKISSNLLSPHRPLLKLYC